MLTQSSCSFSGKKKSKQEVRRITNGGRRGPRDSSRLFLVFKTGNNEELGDDRGFKKSVGKGTRSSSSLLLFSRRSSQGRERLGSDNVGIKFASIIVTQGFLDGGDGGVKEDATGSLMAIGVW